MNVLLIEETEDNFSGEAVPSRLGFGLLNPGFSR